jgi:hypothetical protein
LGWLPKGKPDFKVLYTPPYLGDKNFSLKS